MSQPPSAHGPLPSERKFGLLFAVISLAFLAWGAYKGWRLVALGALGVAAAVFAALALAAPALLRPLNKAWFQLGLLMGRIVNPLVMGVLFFLLITPVAVVSRVFGRDVLRIRRRQVASYWVDREADPTGQAEGFKHQF